MGLFDELDVAGASDNPWAIPDNTYPAVVSDVEVKPNKDGNYGMTLKYSITEGDHAGKSVSEWKRYPHKEDKTPLNEGEISNARSYIKMRLASLDIPEARMNSVGKEDLVGIECYVSTKQNGDFTNVRMVTTTRPAEVASAGPKANPFQ